VVREALLQQRENRPLFQPDMDLKQFAERRRGNRIERHFRILQLQHDPTDLRVLEEHPNNAIVLQGVRAVPGEDRQQGFLLLSEVTDDIVVPELEERRRGIQQFRAFPTACLHQAMSGDKNVVMVHGQIAQNRITFHGSRIPGQAADRGHTGQQMAWDNQRMFVSRENNVRSREMIAWGAKKPEGGKDILPRFGREDVLAACRA
jgi:hypothetical protein